MEVWLFLGVELDEASLACLGAEGFRAGFLRAMIGFADESRIALGRFGILSCDSSSLAHRPWLLEDNDNTNLSR